MHNNTAKPRKKQNHIRGGSRNVAKGGRMASAECEPITEVWGRSPQRAPGAESLVKGSGERTPLNRPNLGQNLHQTAIQTAANKYL